MRLAKLKMILIEKLRGILELVGEDRKIIQERREKTTPDLAANEETFLIILGAFCLIMLFDTLVPWKQWALEVLAAMIALWQALTPG
jgi:hypothetical protein